MLSIIVDKSYAPGTIMLSIIVIHNIAVLGLFASARHAFKARFSAATARATKLPRLSLRVSTAKVVRIERLRATSRLP